MIARGSVRRLLQQSRLKEGNVSERNLRCRIHKLNGLIAAGEGQRSGRMNDIPGSGLDNGDIS